MILCIRICTMRMYLLPSHEPSLFLPGGARAARERLVLRLLYVFRVCLFVCLFVRPHLSRAQYNTSYVTMQLQCTAAFGGLQAKLQQMKVVLCCLDGESVVDSREDHMAMILLGI